MSTVIIEQAAGLTQSAINTVITNASVSNITISNITHTISSNLTNITSTISSNLTNIPSALTNISNNITSNLTSSITSNFTIFNTEINGISLAIAGAAIAVGAAGIASAVGAGIVGTTGAKTISEDPKKFSTSLLFQALPQTQGIYGFIIAILILLGAGVIGTTKQISVGQGLGALGAGLAVGLAAISAIGQGLASSSGLSASAEDKKIFGKSILFSVLPETQALYGFIVAILILIGTGLFGTALKQVPTLHGWAAVGAGLAVGLAGISALGQGIAAAGGIGSVLEKTKVFGKAIIFSVLPETQALYGFIVAILILIGFGILGTINLNLNSSLGLFAISAGVSVGLAAISAIGQGMAAGAGISATSENDKMFGKSILFAVLPETQALYGFLIAILILVGGGIIGAAKVGVTTPMGILALGASLAVGLGAISAIGQGMAASSGVKSVAQKKSMFGKAIIFSILPETQALMGFLVAILLLISGGIIGAQKLGLSIHTGMIAVGAGLAVGLAAISAIGQGFVVSSSINVSTENPKMFGKSLLFSVLPQTQALYGFLISILLMVGGGIIGSTKEGITAATGLVALGAGLSVGLAAISSLGQGIAASAGVTSVNQNKSMFGKAILFAALPETQALYGFLIAILLMVGGGIIGSIIHITLPIGLIALAAGIGVGLAGVSAIGQGFAAASGTAAVSEKPKIFGKAILFAALPETQALYGFLIAILLLVGAGIIGGIKTGLTQPAGFIALGAGLAVGIAAISAIGQGMAAASGASSTAEKPKSFGKSILFSALPETQALYGFLIAVLLLVGAGIIGSSKSVMTMPMAILAIGAAFAVGLGAISAIGQGMAASSGISSVAQKKSMFGKAIIFSILPETQALMGFLVAILLLISGGIIGSSTTGITMYMGMIAIGAGLAVGLAAISAIGQGIVVSTSINVSTEDPKMFGKSLLFSVLPQTQALYGFLVAILLMVGGGIIGIGKTGLPEYIGLIGIGAGISVGLAAISAIGQGISASSGIGSVIENKKMFGKAILFSVLPETQALYGTIISILLLTGAGILGTMSKTITYNQGLAGIGCGIAMGLAAISAIGQGMVAAGGIGASLRDKKSTGKSLVLSVIPETYAIFGLLISILILLGVQLI